MKRLSAVFVLVSFAAACGSSSPAAPTPVSLTISPNSGFVLAGQTSQLTVTAQISNGQQQPVSASWSSDSPGVATVNSSGLVTGVSNGSATITATYQGAVGRATIQVINNYAGSWTGDYNIQSCDASGDFGTGGFCDADGFAAGQTAPINLTLSQTRDKVSGQVALGSIAGSLSGSVGGDGNLNASGSASVLIDDITLTFDIIGFSGHLSGSQLVATWAESVHASGVSGNGYLQLKTLIVTKTASVGVAPLRPQSSFKSLKEVWRAMGGR